jgi:hypothetical protein
LGRREVQCCDMRWPLERREIPKVVDADLAAVLRVVTMYARGERKKKS